jgi:hypothetical protein
VTRAHLQLLLAVIGGLIALSIPLVFVVRAMRRTDRRTRLANAPIAGLVLLCVVSLGAWLWIALTEVQISAKINGPFQTFLLVVVVIAAYLLWLAIPVSAGTWLVFKLGDHGSRSTYARAATIAIGIAALILGVYCAFLAGGAIWDFVSLLRVLSRPPEGPAGIPIVIAGVFLFVFAAVLSSVTGLLMLIAAWALEPRQRWRVWRTRRADRIIP